MKQFFEKNKKLLFWLMISFTIVLLLVIFGLITYNWATNISPSQVYNNDIVQQQIQKRVSSENQVLLDFVPTFLGFSEPKTFLLLFLNNTELRPGGGFIGSYATVKVSEGKVNILDLRGVENLDSQTPESWSPEPPDILKEELKVDKWYFRDSNWSPDFAKSSQKGLKFYKKEKGIAADEIDGVVAATTNVLSELLAVTGPISVQGKNFNSNNVIEKLQYEVHYGFRNRGISFKNRKQILQPFFQKLSNKVKKNLFQNYNNYLDLAKRMLEEKHIVVYAREEQLQKKLEKNDFAGRVENTNSDYLMWVDANLAALKTDHAIDRNIKYQIKSQGSSYIAKVQMRYKHTMPNTDFRTTRYRTYARAFVPKGVKLIEAYDSSEEKTKTSKDIDTGNSLNKAWFGEFITIEPGQTETLSFTYKLPKDIVDQINKGEYKLLTQKQIGTIEPKLTLSFDFGKNITYAKPSEQKKYWGDSKYYLNTNLRTDKKFTVKF